VWSEKRTKKADRILRSVLDGVGAQIVFGVKPRRYHLESWELDGLEQWEVINDADAVAHVHRSLGMDLPTPPNRFTAMHLWRALTDEEVDVAREHAIGLH